MSNLTPLEHAVSRISRVHGPERILRRLRSLVIANHRSLVKRCRTDEEILWSHRVHDSLSRLIAEGDQVLPHRARR